MSTPDSPLRGPVGQKVVCVDGHFTSAVYEHYDHVPLEGKVYTISHLFWGTNYYTQDDCLSVHLTEIHPITPSTAGFALQRFRLLSDIQQMNKKSQAIISA